jgi:peptidoglycan/LPS O-acetylase OafA/YrhL
MSLDNHRIPSLDGIRAISILMVILGHLSRTRGMPIDLSHAEAYAEFGVRVFFVISGFLITSILLSEHGSTGQIALKRFYVRRAYRIFPAAYAFMLVTFVIYWKSLSAVAMLLAATYSSNYHPRPWPLAHLWSLAVEEQFYLLWPAILACFFRFRTKVVVAVILGTPLLNVALFYFKSANNVVGFWFPTVADGLAMGCLLSLAQPILRRFNHILGGWPMLAVTLVTVASPAFVLPESRMGAIFYQLGVRTLQNAGIALSIHNAVLASWRLLNGRIISWFGVISYSLYLWQQPFLNRNSAAVWTSFPLNLALALLCAILSYYFIEKPVLRLRSRRNQRLRNPAPVVDSEYGISSVPEQV